MTIEFQQKVANHLLFNLELIAPHAILAGGAPRDWYMGNIANDLDFYFSLPEGLSSSVAALQLQKILPIGCKPIKQTAEFDEERNRLYQNLIDLRKIHFYEFNGIPVQFIEMESVKAVYRTVDNFDCSICKVWYKNKQVRTTEDFLLTLKTKIIALSNKAYSWSDPHPKKMYERFKSQGFVKGTKEQQINMIVNEAIGK